MNETKPDKKEMARRKREEILTNIIFSDGFRLILATVLACLAGTIAGVLVAKLLLWMLGVK